MLHTPLNIKNKKQCLPYPWHPSVVYIPAGWNGHKYWMAQTPFPPMQVVPYIDRYELPCIHFSDNGKDFYPIESNPIVDLTSDEIKAHNYYSDPHLIYKDNTLILYFRFTILNEGKLEGNKTLLLWSSSQDGTTWLKPEVVADLRMEKDLEIWGEQIISQALCWNENCLKCWYVDKSSYLTNRNIRMTKSIDGTNWDKNILCKLDGPAIDPWHLDVQFYDGKYQMIVYGDSKLAWYESYDGINFTYVSNVLVSSKNRYDFYCDGLYRACSIKKENDIFIYFSAKRKSNSYIGLLKTTDRLCFKSINGCSVISWIFVVWKPLLKNMINKIRMIVKS